MSRSSPAFSPSEVTLRPLACCCGCFALWVFLSVYLLSGWMMLLGGAAALLLGLILLLRGHRLAGALLLAGMMGLWACWLSLYQVGELEEKVAGSTLSLTMEAQDYSFPARYSNEAEVRICAPASLKGQRITLYVRDRNFVARPGDLISAEVKLKSARRDPGKWELSSYANDIFLQGSAKTAQVTPVALPLRFLPVAAAHRMGETLEGLFDEETAGFLFALTTGNRSGLTSEFNQALTETGLRHIVAASGLHVSILVTALFLLPGNRRRKSLLLLPLLIFYAAVAGFSPSICRAVIMEGILLLSPVFDRVEDPITSLSLALAVILLHNPFAAASVSLQLSFSAMLGLLLVTARLPSPDQRPVNLLTRAGRFVQNSLTLTLGANLFTLPLVLYYFDYASGLSPVSNLTVLWLLPLLLPLALLCALTGIVFLPLGRILAAVTLIPAALVRHLIYFLAALPHVSLTGRPGVFLWLGAAQLLTLLILAGVLPRWVRGLSLAGLAGALVLLLLPAPEPTAGVRIDLLDVGQGQCVLLTSEEETCVIDCGSLQHRAGGVLTDALKRRGIEAVDLLILTHYDSDHTNGVEDLLEQAKVHTALLPVPVEEDEERASALSLKLRMAGAELVTVTGTPQQQSLGLMTLRLVRVGEDDDAGTVILCSAGAFDYLVTGDADMDGEAEALQRLGTPDLEVLVGGHHGSKYATGEALLKQTTPEAVLFSVGKNQYGHPTEQALERCRRVGAAIYRTDQDGTITVLAESNAREPVFQIALAKS